MGNTFTKSFTGDAKSMVARARAAAEAQGATILGDEQKGTFNGGGIEGSYSVSGQQVSVTVDRKPVFAPWSMIEQGINRFFS